MGYHGFVSGDSKSKHFAFGGFIVKFALCFLLVAGVLGVSLALLLNAAKPSAAGESGGYVISAAGTQHSSIGMEDVGVAPEPVAPSDGEVLLPSYHDELEYLTESFPIEVLEIIDSVNLESTAAFRAQNMDNYPALFTDAPTTETTTMMVITQLPTTTTAPDLSSLFSSSSSSSERPSVPMATTTSLSSSVSSVTSSEQSETTTTAAEEVPTTTSLAPQTTTIHNQPSSTTSSIRPSTTTATTTTKTTTTTTTTARTTTTTKRSTTTSSTTGSTTTTTTTPPTTTAPAKTQPTKIVITTYGYGHGVGMSQVGAIAMAQSGSTYQEILEHYYPGSKLQLDPSPPSYVTFANEDYGLVDYLARTTEMEIGRGTTAEAFKAQVVAAYTYAKARSFKGLNTTVQAFSYKTPAELSLRYVREVLGMDDMHEKPRPPVLTVNNKPALAPYFASCAGKTTDVTSVWGGSLATYPHLAGGVTSPGKVSIVEVTFTLEQFRSFIRAYNEAYPGSAISLGSDPKQWVKILSHDSAYSSGIGYAKQVQVGDRVVSGNTFRIYVLGGAIRSHCFTISVS